MQNVSCLNTCRTSFVELSVAAVLCYIYVLAAENLIICVIST